jgi:A/G-specific adenine glycosylase
MITADTISAFQDCVWDYFQAHGRHDLPWRLPQPDGSFCAYEILVSELMLQQTQVARVIPKYQQFLVLFPTIEALAGAELGEVVIAWSGLGYNRRAKNLWQAATQITTQFAGIFPSNTTDLISLPGIGKNTAGAILAYAFNQPVVFIETNIRSVYIHHFFKNQDQIPDEAVLDLVKRTLDTLTPREWYWALMDYGTYLKQTVGNTSTRSKQYVKQSAFNGSRRQIRGLVLKQLARGPACSTALQRLTADERLQGVLDELLAEGLIKRGSNVYRL